MNRQSTGTPEVPMTIKRLLAAALALLFGAAAAQATTCPVGSNIEENTMYRTENGAAVAERPAIDRDRPENLVVATFAMG
jgi:hypothetical protein